MRNAFRSPSLSLPALVLRRFVREWKRFHFPPFFLFLVLLFFFCSLSRQRLTGKVTFARLKLSGGRTGKTSSPSVGRRFE